MRSSLFFSHVKARRINTNQLLRHCNTFRRLPPDLQLSLKRTKRAVNCKEQCIENHVRVRVGVRLTWSVTALIGHEIPGAKERPFRTMVSKSIAHLWEVKTLVTSPILLGLEFRLKHLGTGVVGRRSVSSVYFSFLIILWAHLHSDVDAVCHYLHVQVLRESPGHRPRVWRFNPRPCTPNAWISTGLQCTMCGRVWTLPYYLENTSMSMLWSSNGVCQSAPAFPVHGSSKGLFLV
jgi:hypothetical protein